MRRSLTLLLLLVISVPAFAAGVYHEAFCPSVDLLRMTRMRRSIAVAHGLVHAADCDPASVRFLGVSAGWERPPAERRTVQVDAYTKKDGTFVPAHERSYPRRD